MRKLFTLLVLLFSSSSFAQVFIEDFNYTTGIIGTTNMLPTWSGSSSNFSNCQVTSGSLGYSNGGYLYPTNSNTNKQQWSAGSSNDQTFFARTVSGAAISASNNAGNYVSVSFLLNVTSNANMVTTQSSANNTNTYFFSLVGTTTTASSADIMNVHMKKSSTNATTYQLGISFNLGQVPQFTGDIPLNQTVLVVLDYSMPSGPEASKYIGLYVNPTVNTNGSYTVDANTIQASTTAAAATFGHINNITAVKTRTWNNVGAYQIDGIRITRNGTVGLLPLNINTFYVDGMSNDAILNWQVSGATNVKTFEIEHSIDGINFNRIGTLNFLMSKNKYSFTHNGIQYKNFYRLQIIDFDGSFFYSKTVLLKKDLNMSLSVYPNPASSLITVNYSKVSENGILNILGVDGKIILQKQLIPNSTQTNFTIQSLRKGNYVLQVVSNGVAQSFNFTKL